MLSSELSQHPSLNGFFYAPTLTNKMKRNYYASTYFEYMHELNLNLYEYTILDMIYRLSVKNYGNEFYCTMERETMAALLLISVRTLQRYISNLKKRDLIQEHENGKGWLKTYENMEDRIESYRKQFNEKKQSKGILKAVG
jgi:hypothetical protein